MAAFLKRLKSIKQDTKLTVFGYVRQNENKLSLFCNVPAMVSYLCLSYFFHGEYFEQAGDDIQISNDKMTITKISNTNDWYNTSYGKKWIDSAIPQIVEWKFKINEMVDGYSIFLCLVSKDNRSNDDCNRKDDYPNYGFSANGRAAVNSQRAYKSTNWKIGLSEKDYHYHEGDVISMILNTKSRVINFQKQGGEEVTVIGNITINKDIKYKMAISIQCHLCSVSLIDFKCDLI